MLLSCFSTYGSDAALGHWTHGPSDSSAPAFSSLSRPWIALNGFVLAIAALVAFATAVPAMAESASEAISAPATAEPSARAARLERLKTSIRKDYPGVSQLTIDAYLAADEPLTLIDVRAAAEYQRSHIPGALHIEDPHALLEYANAHGDTTLVLYCSVGMRSSQAVQQLQRSGIDRVQNLEGSIFEWSNRALPLASAAGPTRDVHPYNAWWGWRYLDQYGRRTVDD